MQPFSERTVLILIDVQQAFDDPSWGQRNNPQAEARIAALLAGWRAAMRPVIHVQHRSGKTDSLFHPDHPGFRVKPQAQPHAGEALLYKDVNSAFIGTDLQQRLEALEADSVVIAGITTDHCVSTTTRMAGNFGYASYLVADACATFERTGPDGQHYSAELMHHSALASLHGEFATVIDSAAVLAML